MQRKTKENHIPFQLAWYAKVGVDELKVPKSLTPKKGGGEDPEILSLSALNGRFDLYKDEPVMSHLEITNLNVVNVLDMIGGRWITHLRCSPPIQVTASCTLHMKRSEMEIDAKDVISLMTNGNRNYNLNEGASSTPRTKRKAANSPSADIIDLTITNANPMEKKPKVSTKGGPVPISRTPSPILISLGSLQGATSPTVAEEIVGSRPARLSVFPAKTVKEMATRLEWIVVHGRVGTVEQRFAKVFSCEWKESTYYKHQRVWKHLSDTSALVNINGTDLWGPLAAMTEKAMKDKMG